MFFVKGCLYGSDKIAAVETHFLDVLIYAHGACKKQKCHVFLMYQNVFIL